MRASSTDDGRGMTEAMGCAAVGVNGCRGHEVGGDWPKL